MRSTAAACKAADVLTRAPRLLAIQAPNSYQPRNALYCVRAEYKRPDATSPRVQVFNQARTGSVNGPLMAAMLSAVVRDESHGQLAVGPGFLPTFLYGPYWVRAALSRF